MSINDEDEKELDIAEVLGASDKASPQMLSIYIPNKDKNGKKIANQKELVKEAGELFTEIGGGVTIMPAVNGGWLNSDSGKIIWEKPIIVYSYVLPDKFEEKLPELRKFLHKMGRETNQGEIGVEFSGVFYRITEFDEV
jgi:hypothetical protein